LLKEIHIDNSKSIKTMRMEIANLNILVGPNNSGKTSVLQALALLKQSIDQLTFEGPLVNLGDFKDTVHKHDLDKVIGLGFTVLPRRRNVSTWLKLTQELALKCVLGKCRMLRIAVGLFVFCDLKRHIWTNVFSRITR